MKRKKIKSGWTEYFNFSARERRGALFLSFIILVQISVLVLLRNYNPPVVPPDEKLVAAIMAMPAIDNFNDSVYNKSDSAEIVNTLFPFDPNKALDSEMIRLGLSRKQIHVISNYLSHGGKFRIKNDFRKMYCISEKQYASLEPFLLLPDSFQYKSQSQKYTPAKQQPVNIGDADSATFMNLRGIGPVLASRITKYRDKLGGFYSLEQLREVWGINDTLFQNLQPHIFLIDTIPFRFIHLSTDSFQILSSHPYIKGRLAGIICSYRKQHKGFTSVGELLNMPLVTEEIFRKLAPYLRPD